MRARRAATGDGGDHPDDGQRDDQHLKTTSLSRCHRRPRDGSARLQQVYAQTFEIMPLLVVACICTVHHVDPHAGPGAPRGLLRKGFGEKEAEAANSGRSRGRRGHDMPSTSHIVTAVDAARAAAGHWSRPEKVWKSFGKLDVLKGVDLEVMPQQTYVLWAVWRWASRHCSAASTTSRRSTPAAWVAASSWVTGRRRRPARDESQRRGQTALACRHGLPAVQPVPAYDRDRERHGGTHRVQHVPRKQADTEAERFSAAVGLGEKLDTYPGQLWAASSSALPSLARWP